MPRKNNTNRLEKQFSSNTKDQVWEKGLIDSRYDKNIYRYDVCGSWMKYSDYGNINVQYGWEIDHIKPVAEGGSDDLSNLQPLNWNNNRKKADKWPWSSNDC